MGMAAELTLLGLPPSAVVWPRSCVPPRRGRFGGTRGGEFPSDPKNPIEVTLRAMMTTVHLGEAGPHPVIASAARELLNKNESERSGALSSAMSSH